MGGVALAPGSERVDAAFDGTLAEILRTVGATGKQDEVVKIPSMGKIPAGLVVAAGLGRSTGDGPAAEQVRRASGAAARALAGTRRAVTTLSTVDLQADGRGHAARRVPVHRVPVGEGRRARSSGSTW